MSFYIVILLARINARIQALLCKTENGKVKTENLKATDKTQLAHRYAHLFYARVSSSEWGLFGHIARSAFRRTPSGPEMVT